jgi:hypothetical protein
MPVYVFGENKCRYEIQEHKEVPVWCTGIYQPISSTANMLRTGTIRQCQGTPKVSRQEKLIFLSPHKSCLLSSSKIYTTQKRTCD